MGASVVLWHAFIYSVILVNVVESDNVVEFLAQNNVQNAVGKDPSVVLLGIFSKLGDCEGACLNRTDCYSLTWHHTDFPKEEYKGHCYARTTNHWNPAEQQQIDSALVPSRAVVIAKGQNNVKGAVGHDPSVVFAGIVSSLAACQSKCFANHACRSFTWHHTDFPKSEYQGHCYVRTSSVWTPVSQNKIDSGSLGSLRPTPSPPPAPAAGCMKTADCSGYNGQCVQGQCMSCLGGWMGHKCGQVKFKPNTGAKAYDDDLWTWGGSPILGDDGLVHLFSSEITLNCGILHYCSNSRVIHLIAKNASGPFARHDVALEPRAPPYFDSGAVHGPTIHRLPNGTYLLYYMGTKNTWDTTKGSHPDCRTSYDNQQGDRATRRIGVAISNSLYGPWTRFGTPVFGPGNRTKGEWDYGDVSNPTPIILRNGTTIMLYKGRGRYQATGVAVGTTPFGPFERPTNQLGVVPGEDPWGWVQTSQDGTEVMHSFTHDSNGATAAGGHAWSLDGVHWTKSEMAYTGTVHWRNGTTKVVARRERPQVLLVDPTTHKPDARIGSYGIPWMLFTSTQDCFPKTDGGPGTSGCRSYTMVEEIDINSGSIASTELLV